ncbi:MAG: YHS domain-containing protein [bacterium]|nr:YHS domain-containing protein [bacterium]
MRAALIALSSFALALSPSQLAAQEAGEAGAAGQKVDFAKQIAPIFVARCIECHGAEKDKGDLRLDSRAVAFPEGDEDYWSILAGKPEESELLRRVTLPDGDDEIMPEKGEPLSKAEQALIRQWIAEGAEWGESGDAAIAAALKAMEVPKITFTLPALADGQGDSIQAAMQQLKKLGAVVQRVAADTEAVDVNLSLLRDKVTDRELAWLEPLAPRLVWLNLSRTAITDAGAKSLSKLTQLRRLHVANTALTDATVKQLDGLNELEFANFYGTKITDDALPFFLLLPKLNKLHAWQTGVSPERAKAARDNFSKFHVDVGDYAEARMAAAQKEIAEREAEKKAEEEAAKQAAAKNGAPVNDKCPVTGGKVDAAHVVEHDGQKIGFCCAKCKAKFEKNPKKYAAKLPKKK